MSLMFFKPFLSTNLNGVPGAAKRRGVRKIQIIKIVDNHPVEKGDGENINPLGDFRGAMTDDLSP